MGLETWSVPQPAVGGQISCDAESFPDLDPVRLDLEHTTRPAERQAIGKS